MSARVFAAAALVSCVAGCAANEPPKAPSRDALPAQAAPKKPAIDADAEILAIEGFGSDSAAFRKRSAPVLVRGAVAIARPDLEKDLFDRLTLEQHVRAHELTELPAFGSESIRELVSTWPASASADDAKAFDPDIATKVDAIRASMAKSTLVREALAELDDSLDPLERLAEPATFPRTARAIAALRLAVDGTRAAPDGTRDWDHVNMAILAHLGVSASAPELRQRLVAAEMRIRETVKSKMARDADDRAIAEKSAAILVSTSTCDAHPKDSIVRALLPPPERAPACNLAHALATATTDADRLAALTAMHDATVVALWSLDVHEAGLAPSQVGSRVHPLFGTPMDREARWLRVAVARPVVAIGAGLAADLLSRPNADPAKWVAFGDAPLDVMEKEMLRAP